MSDLVLDLAFNLGAVRTIKRNDIGAFSDSATSCAFTLTLARLACDLIELNASLMLLPLLCPPPPTAPFMRGLAW